jgi:pSer/pThr/pTyr-binding forkhead associated (FHA) protein
MMQKTWTIGSDSACDIVVDSSTVSGQHCRLSLNGPKLTLTDLGSTNGTFVNGNRIAGMIAVSITDRITLGQTQSMPWPNNLQPNGSNSEGLPLPSDHSVPTSTAKNERVITLGRGATNTVVLNASNVSTDHARLIVSSEEIILEDLGSTNGTSVGMVENKVTRAKVTPKDTVFLGSTAYQVSDLVARSQPAFVTSVNRSSTRKPSTASTTKIPAGLTAVGVGLLLAIVFAWFLFGDRNDQETQQAAVPTSDVRSKIPSQDPVDEILDTKSVPDVVLQTDALENAGTNLTADEKIARCLFVMVCADGQGEMPFRVGTGFAIDSRHVATSAAVIETMNDLISNGFPDVVLYSPTTRDELRVKSTTLHSQYEIANRAAHQAQEEHDAIFDDLESKMPNPEAFEAVKEKLLASRTKALQAIDRKTSFDVGVIEVEQPLEHWLPGETSESSMRPNLKLKVTGYAFDVEDPFFDRSDAIALRSMESRLSRLTKISNQSVSRMLGKGLSDQKDYAYLGSPALNLKGQVVAVYSRPTPAGFDSGDSDAVATFDAALYQRVRECLVQ